MDTPNNDLHDNLFDGLKPQQASVDFTDRLMDRIQAESQTALVPAPITPYKPVISTRGWFGIAAGVAAVIAVSVAGSPEAGPVAAWLSSHAPSVSLPQPDFDFTFGLDAQSLAILTSSAATIWGMIAIDRWLRRRDMV